MKDKMTLLRIQTAKRLELQEKYGPMKDWAEKVKKEYQEFSKRLYGKK